MRRKVQDKFCSDGADTLSRNVGDINGKNFPKIWGKKWDFLLLFQLMLSLVCSSHVKAEAAVRVAGEEGRALLGSGLWGFMAGFCWSCLLQCCNNPWGREHLPAAFIITESQDGSRKGPSGSWSPSSQSARTWCENLEIIPALFLANEGGFFHPLTSLLLFCSCLVCWICVGDRYPWCLQVPK